MTMPCIRDACENPQWKSVPICEGHWWEWYVGRAMERAWDNNEAPFPRSWWVG